MTPRTLSQQDCAETLYFAALDEADTALGEMSDALRVARTATHPAARDGAVEDMRRARMRFENARSDAWLANEQLMRSPGDSMLAASVERLAEGAR